MIALKGAALHATDMYAAGERPMGDIDLLIREDDARPTSRVLESCGYTLAFTTHRHHVFQPNDKKVTPGGRLGEHVDNPIKIEVHTRIAEPLPVGRDRYYTVPIPSIDSPRPQFIPLGRGSHAAPIAACGRKHSGSRTQVDSTA